MSMRDWTVARRITFGFSIILALVLGLGLFSLFGVGSILGNAREVSEGNRLDANLAQLEIDHLNWAKQLSGVFIDETAKEVNVQIDPHKCGFGKWFYGEERKALEARFPSLREPIAALEEPHTHLHESAARIQEDFKQPHIGLGARLRALYSDYTHWSNSALTQLLAHADERPFSLGVPLTIDKSPYASFSKDHVIKHAASTFPVLAKSMETISAHDRELTKLGNKIQKLVNDGKRDEAIALFAAHVPNEIDHIKSALDDVMAQESTLRDAYGLVRDIYTTETTTSLGKVQQGLRDLRDAAREHILTDEKMIAAANQTRMGVSGSLVLTFAIGIALAAFIAITVRRALSRISTEIDESSQQVAAASTQVSTGSQSLAEGASEQAASLEETSASLQEMDSTARQNAGQSSQAHSMVEDNQKMVTEASQSIDRLSHSMHEIAEAGSKMQKIIKSIDEIAFQTNLLALNAAVEAARAGEAGAGFAVVADEVRSLAVRAAEAAKSTSELISQSTERIGQGQTLANESGELCKKLAETSQAIGEIVSTINQASNQQAESIGEINRAVTEMDKVTQSNAANAEESAAASEQLNAQAQSLQDQVNELRRLTIGSDTDNRKISSNRPTPKPKAATAGFHIRKEHQPAQAASAEWERPASQQKDVSLS